ncbi:kinase-like domain-containing protein [Infundibulicybe gibba]|nr:kinase-like domain-containing protein [Infundibulicybe gibba]
MLKVDSPSPSSDPSYQPTLAALSRNASVISTSSSDSGPSSHLLRTPRPRPLRTFSSPRSMSPGSRSPQASRPPPHLAKELGYAEDSIEARAAEASAKARSKSRGRNIPVTVEDFKFGATLGEGSYSIVKRGTYLRTGQQYAIKVLDKNHLMRKKKMQTALAEKNALVRLAAGHPGVVRLYFAFQDEWSLYFVIDLAKNGEMQSLLSRMGSLCTRSAQYYAAQIVDAIDYMHSRGVLHRDLKPENLLLDENFRIKITDFGTGKILETGMERAETFVGTAQYVSPELLESNETSKSSDFWALGCIIYQMIAGRFAFQGLSEYLTWQKIKQLEYSFPEGFDEQAKDLVQKLLIRDPAERLGVGLPGSGKDMQALRSHPFFSSIKWDTLWTEPAPPLEPGLVKKEHPLAQGYDQNWEDVGASWDDLVGGEDVDSDEELEWAPDGSGPEYRFHQNGYPRGKPDGIDIGPMGEIRRQDPGGHDNGSPVRVLATPTAIEAPAVVTPGPADASACTPLRESPTTASASSSSEGSEKLNSLMESIHLGPLGPSQRLSPDSAQRNTSPDAERGRKHEMTPVQGNGPAGTFDPLSYLTLPEGETIVFNSTVEARTLRRRASRLIPLPVSPSKPKNRQLILTNRRLLCLKLRRKGPVDSISVKSELTLRASEKLKEKDKERESRGIVANVERKGDKEFVVLTSSKSYSYATDSSALANSWAEKINAVLISHGRKPSATRT